MHQGIAELCLEAMKDTQDPSQLGSEDAMIHTNKILARFSGLISITSVSKGAIPSTT